MCKGVFEGQTRVVRNALDDPHPTPPSMTLHGPLTRTRSSGGTSPQTSTQRSVARDADSAAEPTTPATGTTAHVPSLHALKSSTGKPGDHRESRCDATATTGPRPLSSAANKKIGLASTLESKPSTKPSKANQCIACTYYSPGNLDCLVAEYSLPLPETIPQVTATVRGSSLHAPNSSTGDHRESRREVTATTTAPRPLSSAAAAAKTAVYRLDPKLSLTAFTPQPGIPPLPRVLVAPRGFKSLVKRLFKRPGYAVVGGARGTGKTTTLRLLANNDALRKRFHPVYITLLPATSKGTWRQVCWALGVKYTDDTDYKQVALAKLRSLSDVLLLLDNGLYLAPDVRDALCEATAAQVVSVRDPVLLKHGGRRDQGRSGDKGGPGEHVSGEGGTRDEETGVDARRKTLRLRLRWLEPRQVTSMVKHTCVPACVDDVSRHLYELTGGCPLFVGAAMDALQGKTKQNKHSGPSKATLSVWLKVGFPALVVTAATKALGSLERKSFSVLRSFDCAVRSLRCDPAPDVAELNVCPLRCDPAPDVAELEALKYATLIVCDNEGIMKTGVPVSVALLSSISSIKRSIGDHYRCFSEPHFEGHQDASISVKVQTIAKDSLQFVRECGPMKPWAVCDTAAQLLSGLVHSDWVRYHRRLPLAVLDQHNNARVELLGFAKPVYLVVTYADDEPAFVDEVKAGAEVVQMSLASLPAPGAANREHMSCKTCAALGWI